MSIVSISPIFAEPVEVEIDWLIEGQSKPNVPSFSEPIQKNSITDEKNDSISENNILNVDTFEDFVTGSGYTIGNQLITIDSDEGQILNQILIEQKKIDRDNFFHMIKYLDRYSDGYIELAEALIDPVKKQQYQSSGISRDSYINSNLEHFLVERGYSLDDVESIPNDAFSPTKYDDVRTMAANIANTGNGYVDLRELLPNYVKPDSKIMNDEMIRKLSEQTANIYDSLSSSRLDISIKQNPDLANVISNNLFDDFQFVNTKFENTQQVVDSLDKPQKLFEINKSFDTIILFLIPIILGMILLGYFLYRKSTIEELLEPLAVSSSVNYVEYTLSMLDSSRNLFETNPKYAFEKFSQAIRYYYSNKLQINLDLTYTEIMRELKKSKISNYDDVNKWLQLCSQVEFVKHKSSEKEFIKSLNLFSKFIS